MCIIYKSVDDYNKVKKTHDKVQKTHNKSSETEKSETLSKLKD